MPASAKRKVARAVQFGRPPPAVKQARLSPPASAPSDSGPEPQDAEAEDDDEPHGGVALPSTGIDGITDDAAFDSPGSGSDPDEPRSSKATGTAKSSQPKTKAKDKTKDKPRYILFVGNLPFSATAAGIQRHFAAVKPTAVRLRTDKATGASRGFAFIEFDSPTHMDACLTRYHRSEYVEGQKMRLQQQQQASKKGADEAEAKAAEDGDGEHLYPMDHDIQKTEGPQGARRINVQLTAGGGGTSEARRNRLRAKNEKLDRERHQRLKRAKRKKDERGVVAKKKASEADHGFAREAGVHPSRKARLVRK